MQTCNHTEAKRHKMTWQQRGAGGRHITHPMRSTFEIVMCPCGLITDEHELIKRYASMGYVLENNIVIGAV